MLRDIHMTQVLVHGEQNEMARLRAALVREYEDNEVMITSSLVMWFTHPSHVTQDINMEIHSPRNTQAVELYYRGEKMAKVCEPLSLSYC